MYLVKTSILVATIALRAVYALPSPLTQLDCQERGPSKHPGCNNVADTYNSPGRDRRLDTKEARLKLEREQMAKRDPEEMEIVRIEKRGAVGEAAGQILTTLMVVGLLKQLYNAVAPAIQSHLPQSTTPNAASPYGYNTQYSRRPLQSRDVDNSSILQSTSNPSQEDLLMKRQLVMDVASHFVNLGFAVQTVQENVGPITRELTRLEHKALHEARKWMHPEQQSRMKKRSALDATIAETASREIQVAEEGLHRRSVMETVLEHPTTAKVANSASILVTISMLTGLAGRYVDQVIQKAKTMMPGSQGQVMQRARNRYSY